MAVEPIAPPPAPAAPIASPVAPSTTATAVAPARVASDDGSGLRTTGVVVALVGVGGVGAGVAFELVAMASPTTSARSTTP